MKRSWVVGHYLYSRVQSEQASALKTTTLCRAVVCSRWLVIGRWGALLGELCSLPVSPVYLDVCPSYTRIPYTPEGRITLHLAHIPPNPGPDRAYNLFRATTVLK